jgi:hypothetical protein
MKTITLTSDGSIIADNESPRKIDPIEILGNQVALAEGYRFRSFFKMLSAYPDLMRLSVFFPGMMQRYRDVADEGSQNQTASPLEFGKTIEMIGFPGNPRIELYNSFRKSAQGEATEIRSNALSGLLNTPIKLGKLHHIVFGDKVNVFEFETAYTFFEFIDGIAWELGFLTTPEECQLRR